MFFPDRVLMESINGDLNHEEHKKEIAPKVMASAITDPRVALLSY